MLFPRGAAWIILVLSALCAFTPRVRAQQIAGATEKANAPLTSEEVVRNLKQMNRNRAEALHSYQGSRTYRVEYRGFPGNRSADMAVAVKYLSPGSKDFVIESVSGSGLIIDKVFKKLLEAEKEALVAESQRRSALTEENYKFTLVGYERGLPNSLYVLEVEPLTKEKFLYRGKIWVDAVDFAVVRMEVTPAKNPSFWTRNSQIEQVYKKVGEFWLPASNKSVSSIRLGGHAELTILYVDYRITGGSEVRRLAPATPNLTIGRATQALSEEAIFPVTAVGPGTRNDPAISAQSIALRQNQHR